MITTCLFGFPLLLLNQTGLINTER